MQEKRRKYSPEFKVEAARLVVESSRPIVEVAREIGVHEGTLGSWVSKYRTEHAVVLYARSLLLPRSLVLAAVLVVVTGARVAVVPSHRQCRVLSGLVGDDDADDLTLAV
jgi:transposase-like protein